MKENNLLKYNIIFSIFQIYNNKKYEKNKKNIKEEKKA